jgi:hypothetical protein
LRISNAGTTTGAANDRHVVGNLAKSFSVATTFAYPVGDGTSLTTVNVLFAAAVTGSLTVAMTATQAADHPNTTAGSSPAEPNRSVNRYWTIKNSTIPGTQSANVTFNYLSASPRDLDSGVAAGTFVVGRGGAGTCSGTGGARVCTTWSRLAVVGTPTTTQIVATASIANGAAQESDFVIGEARRSAREKEFIYTRETY